MEETEKGISSSFFRKKVEKTGRKWKKLEEMYMKPNKDTNKPVEISFQILNTGMSMQIFISQISGILQGASAQPTVLSNTFHYFMYSRPKHAQMPTP